MGKFIKKNKHKINRDITCPQVRLVGEGMEPQVISTYEAQRIAYNEGKDLILISENANPPVARIEEYTKFLYKIERQEKERKKNSVRVELKEIQLSCVIADNDLNTKAKKSIEFLKEGNKVKCVILLKGRQRSMPEAGELVMLKFADVCSAHGTPEAMPKLEGSRWIMNLKPKK